MQLIDHRIDAPIILEAYAIISEKALKEV